MKKKLFLLFSLFIVTNRSSLSNSESGLIFFTNFNYFKSNEKEFKIKNSNINLPIESSEKNPTLLPPVTTPSKPNITTPSILLHLVFLIFQLQNLLLLQHLVVHLTIQKYFLITTGFLILIRIQQMKI